MGERKNTGSLGDPDDEPNADDTVDTVSEAFRHNLLGVYNTAAKKAATR